MKLRSSTDRYNIVNFQRGVPWNPPRSTYVYIYMGLAYINACSYLYIYGVGIYQEYITEESA